MKDKLAFNVIDKPKTICARRGSCHNQEMIDAIQSLSADTALRIPVNGENHQVVRGRLWSIIKRSGVDCTTRFDAVGNAIVIFLK